MAQNRLRICASGNGQPVRAEPGTIGTPFCPRHHACRTAPLLSALAGSNLAAQSAEQLSLAAVPLVAVLALGAGPGEIGTLAAVQTLPFLLLSIPLGVLADRVSRRRLMLWAEGLRALSLMALLAMVVTGQLSIAGLAILGFAGAVGTVGFSVAAPALVPALVPRELLGRANGRLELARSAAYAGGPALAGALVAWAGASAAFIIAAMLSISAVALLGVLSEPVRAAAPQRHPLLEIKEGAQFVWRQPYLRPMLLTGVAWNIAWFVLQAAYVPYAVRALGLGAQAVGMTLAGYGAGMVVGALLASRVVGAMPFGRAIQLGPIVSVLAAAAMVATLASADRRAGRDVLLPVRRRPDRLDHHVHHAAPEHHARPDAGPRVVGVPHRERRGATGRRRVRRPRGRGLGRAGVPLAGAGRVRAAGLDHPGLELNGLRGLPAPAH